MLTIERFTRSWVRHSVAEAFGGHVVLSRRPGVHETCVAAMRSGAVSVEINLADQNQDRMRVAHRAIALVARQVNPADRSGAALDLYARRLPAVADLVVPRLTFCCADDPVPPSAPELGGCDVHGSLLNGSSLRTR